MPELPEVETVCRGLATKLEGRRLSRVVQRRPDLRFPFPKRFAARLQGRRVVRVSRRAKYILIHLDDDNVVLSHLGMSGSMIADTAPVVEFDRHDHIVFETDDGTAIRFNDARRFGFMDLVARIDLDRHPLLAKLGPEPLSNGCRARWQKDIHTGRTQRSTGGCRHRQPLCLGESLSRRHLAASSGSIRARSARGPSGGGD